MEKNSKSSEQISEGTELRYNRVLKWFPPDVYRTSFRAFERPFRKNKKCVLVKGNLDEILCFESVGSYRFEDLSDCLDLLNPEPIVLIVFPPAVSSRSCSLNSGTAVLILDRLS